MNYDLRLNIERRPKKVSVIAEIIGGPLDGMKIGFDFPALSDDAVTSRVFNKISADFDGILKQWRKHCASDKSPWNKKEKP